MPPWGRFGTLLATETLPPGAVTPCLTDPAKPQMGAAPNGNHAFFAKAAGIK
jgi:hypothetical protein